MGKRCKLDVVRVHGGEFMIVFMIVLNDHVFLCRKLLGSAGPWFIAIRCIMLS